MPSTVSKSRFKAQALELFRQVERTGKPITITDRKPVCGSPRLEDPGGCPLRARQS
jgi:hypothetical protein